jgi:hypothetical protein
MPKLGLAALQAAMICGSIGGNGLTERGRCAVSIMIGRMQSNCSPSPAFAAPGMKPAWRHAAVI